MATRRDSVVRSRGEQTRRARELRAQGRSWAEIGRVLHNEYPDVGGLKAMRLAHGWSQREAAEHWSARWPDHAMTAKKLSTYECWPYSGGEPQIHDLVNWADLYGCDVADLVMGIGEYGHRDEQYSGPVDRREFLRAAGASIALPAIGLPVDTSARVGPSDVARMAERMDTLRVTCHRQGGGAAYRPMLEHLGYVQRVLGDGTYGSSTGRDLRSLAGHIQREMGFCAFDAGDQDTARRHYTEALSAATLAADDELAVWTLLGMAQQATELGYGREAVAAIEAGEHHARRFTTDRLQSVLSARKASGYARAGDRAAADAAWVEAERLYQPYRPGLDPVWLGAWWSPADYRAGLARGRMALGAPHAAGRAAREALDSIDREVFPRNAASYASLTASAVVARGDVDEGAALVIEAVELLGDIRSRRIGDRLTKLRPALREHAGVQGVDRALDVLQTV